LAKHRVDVEDHAAKIKLAVAHHITDGETGTGGAGHINAAASLGGKEARPVHGLKYRRLGARNAGLAINPRQGALGAWQMRFTANRPLPTG
jgi:hypothetical protein